jgi:hypothetical protein
MSARRESSLFVGERHPTPLSCPCSLAGHTHTHRVPARLPACQRQWANWSVFVKTGASFTRSAWLRRSPPTSSATSSRATSSGSPAVTTYVSRALSRWVYASHRSLMRSTPQLLPLSPVSTRLDCPALPPRHNRPTNNCQRANWIWLDAWKLDAIVCGRPVVEKMRRAAGGVGRV